MADELLPAGVSRNAALDYLAQNVDNDLVHLFQECGTPLGLQYRICQNFKTVRRFASYADSRGEVRTALKDDLRLEADSQSNRAAIAAVVSTWEASKEYSTKQNELKVEARVLGVTRPITQNERIAMRTAFEAEFGKVEESFEPSDDYISQKMEEYESSELVASPLSEVTSKKKAKNLSMRTSVDSSGQIRLVKQRGKGAMPQNSEELRLALRIEGTAYCFLASKYRNRAIFKDMSPEIWFNFVNFVLGEKCYLLQVPVLGKGSSKNDFQPLRPPWVVILTYEYELRREAIKRAVRGNLPIASTIKDVTEDAQIKEQFFTAPIALGRSQSSGWSDTQNWKRQASWVSAQQQWQMPDPPKWQRSDFKGTENRFKGGKKGKWKGSSKGEGKKGGGSQTTGRTPDGRMICFAYNHQGCDGSCGMAHVCMIKGCYANHPQWQHWSQKHGERKQTDETQS